jgi:hypothetical protein
MLDRQQIPLVKVPAERVMPQYKYANFAAAKR